MRGPFSSSAQARRRVAQALSSSATLAVLLSLALLASAIRPAAAADVQSILLRAVTVTYDLERSLLFYRDILGQEVVEDVVLSTERSRSWLDVSATAELRFVVLRGRAE